MVTYTGTTSGSSSLYVGLYDSSYTNQITANQISSGTVNTLIDTNTVCSPGSTAYVLAWYGSSSSGPNPGDHYYETTATEVASSTQNATISFGNTAGWP
jgi:hypothetical protein